MYCTSEDINPLFGDISDDISQELFDTVIMTSASWINSNLSKNYIPLPSTIIPLELKTAAIYYSASDILLSLYHGDDLPLQYDVWFQKAETLLDDYMNSYKAMEADKASLARHQQVKHSKTETYNERRGRGVWRNWTC